MDACHSGHPSDKALRAYAQGRLGDVSAQRVGDHLDNCPDCMQKVACQSSDIFLRLLRQVHADDISQSPQVLPALSESRGSSSAARSVTVSETPESAASPPETVPTELLNHPDYEIRRILGRGGMGVLYLAHNRLMGRDEALKVVGRHIIGRPGVIDRFLREIRAVASLRHPNIVAAYTAFRGGESLVFAMEYVDGLDLARLVKSRGTIPVENACSYVRQAALGLQHAYEQGMVHRDIKPSNLMLSHSGNRAIIKVLDFGLSKAGRENNVDQLGLVRVGQSHLPVGNLTHAGQMLGTPDFIAPEQIDNAQSADIRADIYSLGCTLYYLLSGRPPFQGKTLYDVLQAHHSLDAQLLNFLRPEVPSELAALVAKMMAKDPEARFQTPEEVANCLTPFYKRETGNGWAARIGAARSVRPATEVSVSGSNASSATYDLVPEVLPVEPDNPIPSGRGVKRGQAPEGTEGVPQDATRRYGRMHSLRSWLALAGAVGFVGIVLGSAVTYWISSSDREESTSVQTASPTIPGNERTSPLPSPAPKSVQATPTPPSQDVRSSPSPSTAMASAPVVPSAPSGSASPPPAQAHTSAVPAVPQPATKPADHAIAQVPQAHALLSQSPPDPQQARARLLARYQAIYAEYAEFVAKLENATVSIPPKNTGQRQLRYWAPLNEYALGLQSRHQITGYQLAQIVHQGQQDHWPTKNPRDHEAVGRMFRRIPKERAAIARRAEARASSGMLDSLLDSMMAQAIASGSSGPVVGPVAPVTRSPVLPPIYVPSQVQFGPATLNRRPD